MSPVSDRYKISAHDSAALDVCLMSKGDAGGQTDGGWSDMEQSLCCTQTQ